MEITCEPLQLCCLRGKLCVTRARYFYAIGSAGSSPRYAGDA
jgi:hypothetical protein